MSPRDMSTSEPNATATADLLRTARDVLRGELMPSLPAAQRYPAAMVANAMAIAARELEHGPRGRAELHALYGRIYPDAAETTLEELERRLARDLRTGWLGPQESPALRAVLAGRTRLRLEISNPDHPGAARPG